MRGVMPQTEKFAQSTDGPVVSFSGGEEHFGRLEDEFNSLWFAVKVMEKNDAALV